MRSRRGINIEDMYCAFCDAAAGQPCVSRHGTTLNYYHKRRRQTFDSVQKAAARKAAHRRSIEPSWVRRLILKVTDLVA